MDGLRAIIQHASCPNIILYGPRPSPHEVRRYLGITEIVHSHHDPTMRIVYYHNYTEFNVRSIRLTHIESWKRALEDSLKKTSYFTDNRRYIALTNFEDCKSSVQDYLRVILETNPLTTFLLFTTRYHSVREALRSRCIGIRIPHEPTLPADFKPPENILTKQLYRIYHHDFESISQGTLKELKRISFEIHKHNLSMSHIMRDLAKHIMEDVRWPHALKYKTIAYLADQEYKIRHSYRTLIHTEATFLQVYHLLSSEHYECSLATNHEIQCDQEK